MTDHIGNLLSKLLDRSKGRILLGTTLVVLGVTAAGLLYGRTKPAPAPEEVAPEEVAPEEVAPALAPEEVAPAPTPAPKTKAPKKAEAAPASKHTCDCCKDTTVFVLKLKDGVTKMVPCNGPKGGSGCPYKASLPPTESVACPACHDTGKFRCWTKESKVIELKCKGPKGGDGCKAPGKTESVKPKCKSCNGTGLFKHKDENITPCRCTTPTTGPSPAKKGGGSQSSLPANPEPGAPPVKKGKGRKAPAGEPPVMKGEGAGGPELNSTSNLGPSERRSSILSLGSAALGGAGGPPPVEGEVIVPGHQNFGIGAATAALAASMAYWGENLTNEDIDNI
jgi:hypothetical protein